MKIYFHEIKDQDLEYSFNEETPWVMEVVGSLDERMDQITRPPGWKPRSRPTTLQYTIRRVDELIHVQGKVKTQLQLLCSLCADPFPFNIETQFNVLLTQTDDYEQVPHEKSHRAPMSLDDQDWFSKSAEDEDDLDADEDTDDSNAPPADFEVTVVKDPVADLKEILNEQLVLLIPMQPKPALNDKGDCSKCGRAQMIATYAGKTLAGKEEPLKESPFAVLKTLDLTKKKNEQ